MDDYVIILAPPSQAQANQLNSEYTTSGTMLGVVVDPSSTLTIDRHWRRGWLVVVRGDSSIVPVYTAAMASGWGTVGNSSFRDGIPDHRGHALLRDIDTGTRYALEAAPSLAEAVVVRDGVRNSGEAFGLSVAGGRAAAAAIPAGSASVLIVGPSASITGIINRSRSPGWAAVESGVWDETLSPTSIEMAFLWGHLVAGGA